MRALIWIIALIAINFVIGYFFPVIDWWYIAITALLAGYASKLQNWQAWLIGFVSVFVLWTAAAYSLDAQGGHVLSPKIASLFSVLTANSTIVLFVLVGLLGGLVSGFASLFGALLRSFVI